MSVDGPPVSGALPQAETSLVGEVLDGRYKITRKLGEGGMGEVYAAEHVHIEKRFAIKLLRPEIVSNQEAVSRFQQEARSSSSIKHHNIIAIEDFGRLADGRIYMCMELLDGAALNDLITTPQPVERLLNILIQTGHGLAAAHARNIVHRDMKPENIFVTVGPNQEDIPKILDFGIAKVAGNDGQNNLTRTGTIFGTPFYMAPEQALGNPVDARTDIYAMGVIMYEVFSGSVPFRGESFMGILTQHITTEPEPVTQRAAAAGRSLPPGLPEIVARCMQKNPAQRFASMDELVNALIQIYRGVAGAGMSTYMEAFPVSAAHPAVTPPPLTGPMPISGSGAHSATIAAPSPPGHAPAHAFTPTGGAPAASASGLYPGAPVVAKSRAPLLIAILAVLAVGGGIAAMVLLGGGKEDKAGTGAGSQVASNGSGGAGSGEATDPGVGSGSDVTTDPGAGSGSDTSDAGSGSQIVATNGSGTGSGDVTNNGSAAGSNAEAIAPDAGVPAAKIMQVLLFVRPKAFEVWEDDVKVADSPESIDIPVGGKRKVVIKADGFRDKSLTIDTRKKGLQISLSKVPRKHVPDPTPTVKCTGTREDMRVPGPCRTRYCKNHGDEPACMTE